MTDPKVGASLDAAIEELAPEWGIGKVQPSEYARYTYLGNGLWIRSDLPVERWGAICTAAFNQEKGTP